MKFLGGLWYPLFLISIIFPISCYSQQQDENEETTPRGAPSILQRFWNIGCEFSGVVTRVRRSADNPPVPEPNFDDPEELFNYLYPLANVGVPGEEDGGEGESQRSSSPPGGTHSISSWLEDLMELWHSECHHRREKRSAERRASSTGSSRKATNDGRIRRKEYAWVKNAKRPSSSPASGSSSKNSSLLNAMRRQGYEEPTNGNSGPGDGYQYDNQYGRDEAGILMVEEALEDKEEDILEVIEEEKENEKDKLAAIAGLLPVSIPDKPAVASNVPTMADNKAEDIFFSQYGGDIEYFFPLISFGIPFDGEITLLGFHGFRGIFPY